MISDEVERFKRWRDSGADDTLGLGHGAEWESNYPYWESLYEATRQAIEDPEGMDIEAVSMILFVLARDNEDEQVSEMLRVAPEAVQKLMPRIFTYSERDARWQFADLLPDALGAAAKEPLHRLLNDQDEYVRRRAAAALQRSGLGR